MSKSLADFTPEIDNALSAFVDSCALPEPLAAAVRYALFSGGKRVRPNFALMLGLELGVDKSNFLPVAAAIELLHAASLVHDDLPALDNDDFRRGKAACHRAFSEATALLAGDLMVVLAPESVLQSSYPPELKLALVGALQRAFRELCIGQQLDLSALPGRAAMAERYRLKTGALFACAATSAAIAAGLKGETISAARELGYCFGEGFQIVDDLIDEYADLKGRSGGSDQRNQKSTSLVIGDYEAYLTDVEDRMSAAIAQLQQSAGVADCSGVKQIWQRVRGGCHGTQK